MHNILISLFSALLAGFRSRRALQTEILALQHQIIVLKRSVNRPKLQTWDRFLWIWLLRLWPQWRSALVIVKPETVIAWHRKGFRLFWTRKCRHGKSGRPEIPKDVRELNIFLPGELPGFMESCLNSGSTFPRQLSPNTCSGIQNRPLRHGAHFCKTTPNSLPRSISSPSRQSPSAFSTSSSFFPISGATSYTSTLRPIQPQNGLHSSFFTLFLMTPLLNTSSGIEIAPMAWTFNAN
jgi:hypothetical protein